MVWWNPLTWGKKEIPSGSLDVEDIRAIRIVRAYISGQISDLQKQLDTLDELERTGDKEMAEQYAVILKGLIQGFENSPGTFESLMKHDKTTLNDTVLERLLLVEKRKKR